MPVQVLEKGDQAQFRGSKSVQHLMVGLGWDTNAGQSTSALDLDAAVVARDASGEAQEVCYYGNLNPAAWIKHSGDNLTGEGDGDDEQIHIDLSQVPANIVSLDVVVHIYQGAQRHQSFGMVENAAVRLVNNDTEQELFRYDLSNEDKVFEATGLYFVRISRSGPAWAVTAVGESNPAYATLNSFSQTNIS